MTPPAIEPGPPDPTLADPMLRVLRERHPEVDIVGYSLGAVVAADCMKAVKASRAVLRLSARAVRSGVVCPPWTGGTSDMCKLSGVASVGNSPEMTIAGSF